MEASIISEKLLNDSLDMFIDLGLTSHQMSRLSGLPPDTMMAGLKRIREHKRRKRFAGATKAANVSASGRAEEPPREEAIVLLAEKDVVVAKDLASELNAQGIRVSAVATSVSGAIKWLENNELDFALLNVRLNDGFSYPIAARLSASGVPFAFFTGRDQSEIIAEFRGIPCLTKPQDTVVVAEFTVRILETLGFTSKLFAKDDHQMNTTRHEAVRQTVEATELKWIN